MERYKALARVLALDLHPRCFGYVVAEGQSKLLDWGVCSSRQKGVVSDVLVRKRLRLLIDLWRPAALVLKNPPRVMQKPNHRRKGLLERIETEARKHRIPVRILEDNPVGSRGERLTKYEIARRVAERFPVLRQAPAAQTADLGKRTLPYEHLRCSCITLFAEAITARSRPESFPADADRNFLPEYRTTQTHSAR